MKKIELNIEDDAFNELMTFIGFRKMTGNDIGPDYRFIFGILYALQKEWQGITITKEWLEDEMQKMKSKE